jgi:hypothetical protein
LSANDGCFCARDSRAASEAVFGTASRVDVWLLLEYGGRWGEDAFGESDLPAPVKDHVRAWLDITPRSRLVLVKGRTRRATDLTFAVALIRERGSVLYELRMGAYEDLLALDLGALLAGEPSYHRYISSRPVFLVCTHGVHDKCCALYGRPVFAALAGREQITTWQSSHVGGDRFAANVVCLPDGVYYGRVDPAHDVEPIVAAHRRGEVYLPAYRGRSCYSFIVQAAEHFIRQETGKLGIEDLHLVGAIRLEGGRWDVAFEDAADGLRHTARVARERMGIYNRLVCKAQEPSELTRFRLDDLRTVVAEGAKH